MRTVLDVKANCQSVCPVLTSPFCLVSVCVDEQKDKTEPFDVEEVLQEMPREQRQTLWRKLASLLQAVLQEFPAERWEERKEDGMEVESAGDPVSGPLSICTAVG